MSNILSRMGSSNLQIGLIGAGMIGQMHARAISEVAGLKLVAIADLRPELGRQVAAAYGIPQTYRTHYALLSDPAVDAVAVVVGRNAISAVVRDCLLAGKATFSASPMAMTATSARDLAELARNRDLFYAIGFHRRHDPGMACCREWLDRLLRTDELGRLVFIRQWNRARHGRATTARSIATDEVPSPALHIDAHAPPWLPPHDIEPYHRFVSTYCHDINALHYLFDRSPRIRAADLNRFGAQSLILGYDKFITSLGLNLSEVNDGPGRCGEDEGLEFHFEAGRLGIAFPPPFHQNRNAAVTLRRGSGGHDILCDGVSDASAVTLQMQNLLADISGPGASRVSGTECVKDMILIEQIWKTALCCRAKRDVDATTAPRTAQLSIPDI